MMFVSFLDGIGLFFILGMGILGFRHGFIEELGRLFGLVVSSVIALKTYVLITGWISAWVNIDAWILLILSFIVVFSVVLLATRLLTKILQFVLITKGSKWANRSLGFIFGGIKGGVLIAVVVWLVDISPVDKWSDILHAESTLAKNLTNIRINIITAFHWEDPVKEGEDYIKYILESNESENG